MDSANKTRKFQHPATVWKIVGEYSCDFLIWRDGSGDTVEILDIVVDSDRRKGRGRQLIEALFKMLPAATKVFAITRTSNLIAQQFYEKLGFSVTGILRNFYGSAHSADAVMYGRSSSGPV